MTNLYNTDVMILLLMTIYLDNIRLRYDINNFFMIEHTYSRLRAYPVEKVVDIS